MLMNNKSDEKFIVNPQNGKLVNPITAKCTIVEPIKGASSLWRYGIAFEGKIHI